MSALAQTDRQYSTQARRATEALKRPALAQTIRHAEKKLVRAAIATKIAPATVTTRLAPTGKLIRVPATPRFQLRTETAHRITTIDSMVRELATKHRNLNGMPLDLLALQFKVKPRSIEAMLRRNADAHTLRIERGRVKLSTQQTLDLIDQQKRPKKGTA
jgi:hypothetical protein